MDEKESKLVDLVISGHAEAFEPLVRPYRTALLGLAFRLTGDPEEAKEACQEALLRAFRHLRTFDRGRSFKGWLLSILANCSRDFWKKRRSFRQNETALAMDIAARSGDPGRQREAGELRSRITDGLRLLTAREREVFLLRDLEENTIRETAGILGCSTLSVRVHLSRARRKLGEGLRRGGFGPRGEGR